MDRNREGGRVVLAALAVLAAICVASYLATTTSAERAENQRAFNRKANPIVIPLLLAFFAWVLFESLKGS